MAFTIYDASITPMIRMLENLSKIIDKAITQAKQKDVPPSELFDAKLAPDMRTFPFQIQSASDTSKGCAARLAGLTPPSMPDTETTLPELQARIGKTVDFLKTITREQVEGAEDREVVLKFPSGEMKFTGRDYVTGFALPNFYFHVTTAYAILRHKGIEIGKMDFLGGV
ncbi:MAG TPA: DUF1993 domain-containing protein [Rhizomicrobium sp.]|jgi:hypothetical protein|nr:DUF1993 domain-containing protein [Rhizomicrobium sp.]